MMFITLVSILFLSASFNTAGGTCRLRAEVRMQTERGPQLRLQLLCDGQMEGCPVTNYVDCDTYDALNTSQSCMGEGCTRLFTLTELKRDSDTQTTHSYPTISDCPTPLDCRTTSLVPTSSDSPTTLSDCLTLPGSAAPSESASVKPPTANDCQQNCTITSSTRCSSSTLIASLGAFMVLLVLVTTGWVWACLTVKKLGGMKLTSRERGTMFPSSQNEQTAATGGQLQTGETEHFGNEDIITSKEDSMGIRNDISVTNTIDLNMSENAAYHTNTLLHRNPAYEDNCALQTDDPQLTGVEMTTREPEYEIIPPATDGTSGPGVVKHQNDYH